MKKLNIIQFTIGGRDDYLYDSIEAIYNDFEWYELANHHIICQGCDVNQGIKDISETHGITIHKWFENIGIALGIQKILNEIEDAQFTLKLDDDAKLIDSRARKVLAMLEANPRAVWSPYPVGLINNPGGVPKCADHDVQEIKWGTGFNRFITRRPVKHVGGFCRFTPTEFLKSVPWKNDLIRGSSGTEDSQVSQHAQRVGLPMFYCENEFIVEHQESTLGQHKRYSDYFTDGRF